MPRRSNDEDELGLGTKFTLGLVLWKTLGATIKVGLMAAAVVLGWQLVNRMFGPRGLAEAGTLGKIA